MKLLRQNRLKVPVSTQFFVIAAGIVGSVVGVCLAQRALAGDWLIYISAYGAALAVSILLWFTVKRLRATAVLILAFCLGSGMGAGRFYWVADEWRSEVASVQMLSGQGIPGVVYSQPTLSNTARGGQLNFEFLPDGYQGRIRVSWYRVYDASPALGERWRLPIKLGVPDGFDNHGVSRYSEWLAASKVIARGYISGSEGSLKLSDGNRFLSSNTVRETLADVVSHWLGSRPARPVIHTLVTGERADYSDELSDQIRRSGISHLLAISGLHIGIVATMAALLGRLALAGVSHISGARLTWWKARCVLLLFSALGAVSYAWVSGFAIPTQRALLMLSVVSVCLLLKRRPAPFFVLLWVMFAVVLYDPMAALLAGFWLSFTAVAIILLVLTGRKYTKLQFDNRLLSAAYWLYRQLRLLVTLQLALSIGLAPLAIVFFSQLSLVSPFANLIAVPLFSFLVVPLALGSAVAGSLWLPLGAPLLVAERIAHIVLEVSQALLLWADSAATAVWTSGSFNRLGIAVLVIGLLLLYLPRALGLRGLAVLLLIVCVISPSSKTEQRPRLGELRVRMLDVGHGLAVHLQTKNYDAMYDTGALFSSGNSAAKIVLVPYLRSLGVSGLDSLVISHSDNDHSGGVGHLEASLDVKARLGWEGDYCTSGKHWNWDGIEFSVLSPRLTSAHDSNNESCVLLLDVSGRKVLITGDIERKAEREMLAIVPKVDLLTVPHHGSNTSSTAEWLAQTSPKIALASASRGGRFNFPHSEVIQRYESVGADLLTTGDSGSISVLFTQNGEMTVTKSRDFTPWWLADLQ